tara:strand:- start:73 stop:1026 length:954 start_codon:yes stop_codon:yes gene_type:complete
MKCSKCKKEKDETSFQVKTKTFKSCFDCREQSRKWREKNKKRVSDYNKLTLQKKNKDKKNRVIYARKKEDEEWLEFKSQAAAAKELKLHTANISRVLNGKLSQTGGYIFKIGEVDKEKKEIKTWEEIKEEKNYGDLVRGQPSQKRILHETIDDVIGKKCCKCKEWKPLEEYNLAENHWDKLRNDCKECLVNYRKTNVKRISKHYIEYEKERKKTDPTFKLLKTLRSRLSNAIKNKGGRKYDTTINLTGCDLAFLKGYLEAKFTEGMTWENHGKWHIDHIVPCCSFNLEDAEEQKKCFHYTNLQPLWARDNLVKGGKC